MEKEEEVKVGSFIFNDLEDGCTQVVRVIGKTPRWGKNQYRVEVWRDHSCADYDDDPEQWRRDSCYCKVCCKLFKGNGRKMAHMEIPFKGVRSLI